MATRHLLNETISLKNETEKIILRQLIVLFVIIMCFWIPPFLIFKFAEGNLTYFVIAWIVASFLICLWIRKTYLEFVFPKAMSEYDKNTMKSEIMFIIFYHFKEKLLENKTLIEKKEEILSLIRNDFSIYSVSIIEHKATIFILGILLGLIGNFINNIFWHFSTNGSVVNIKIYSLYFLSACYLLFYTWFFSKEFLDKLTNKKSLRDLVEYLELIDDYQS